MTLRRSLGCVTLASVLLIFMGTHPARCDSIIYNPPSQYPHTLDGYFTGWNPINPPPTYEWYDITPIKGVYSYLYLDYTTDGTLWLMNDWVGNTQGIGDNQYNYFNISYGNNDFQAWMYLDPNRDHFELNGQPLPRTDWAAAYGFGPSPNDLEDHTMYEFYIKNFPALPKGSYYRGTECDFLGPGGKCMYDQIWLMSPQQGGGNYDGPAPTPEPTAMLLLSSGALLLWGFTRRKIGA
jgi:hypothetical protein